MKKEEFEQIYKETYNDLLKFIIIKCYNIDDVNDIIQDTYIELYKILNKKNRKIDNLKSFLNGISLNIIKRHYHKKDKITFLQNIDEENEIIDTIPDNIDIEDDFIKKENVKKVWNYIKSKDPNTIKIFYLFFRLDEKIVDIANELSLSESYVKNKLYRTLKEIKKEAIENE